jgi:hypothetical protein
MVGFMSIIISSSLLLLTRQTLTRQAIGAALTSSMASFSTSSDVNNSKAPSPLTSLKPYYQLLLDDKGETSMVQRHFQNVETKEYAAAPQLVKQLDPNFAKPTNIVFTQLAGENPWHYCPAPQIVICVAGGWYVKTSDGKTTRLLPGDVLYQDNTKEHPSAQKDTRKGMHFSGSLGDEPCDQVIIQLELTDGARPKVSSKDLPGPL